MTNFERRVADALHRSAEQMSTSTPDPAVLRNAAQTERKHPMTNHRNMALAVAASVAVAGIAVAAVEIPGSGSSSHNQPTAEQPTSGSTGTTPVVSTSQGPCLASQVAISVVRNGSASGTHIDAIIVRNTSAQSCTIQGPPGVSLQLADSSRVQVTPGTSSTSANPLIKIDPGKTAWAPLYYSDYSNGETPSPCGNGNTLLVTLPDQTQAKAVGAEVTSCEQYRVDGFRSGMPHLGLDPKPTFTK